MSEHTQSRRDSIAPTLPTGLVNVGRPHSVDAGVNPVIDFSTTYRYAPGTDQDPVYVREGGPSLEPLEQVIAYSEHPGSADAHARVFSSGLAAVSAVFQLLPPGSQVVMDHHGYMGSAALAEDYASRGLVDLHRVDIADNDAVSAVLHQAHQRIQSSVSSEEASFAQERSHPSLEPGDPRILLWIESPTNPMLDVADIPELLRLGRAYGALSCVDNTFATPLGQQPLTQGADIVVHSVTKFLSGHSDVLMGAVVTTNTQLDTAIHNYRTLYGCVSGPMDIFLALRGIRTLSVRHRASTSNAGYLAQKLHEVMKAQPQSLQAVRYPGLPSHPHHLRAQDLLANFGAILTIDAGSAENADRIISRLRIWTPATSLGGVESLAERRRRHSSEPVTIPEGLIRLAVGIEDPEDLFQDLLQAIGAG